MTHIQHYSHAMRKVSYGHISYLEQLAEQNLKVFLLPNFSELLIQ